MIRRIQKLLYGLGYVFDALICDHTTYEVDKSGFDEAWKHWKLNITTRKWHPAFWCGWVRCNLLHDKCGAAIYAMKPRKARRFWLT